MELNYLRVFYEVAKVGRFTEAAKRLNISQSALSRSVALLEESQGVKLLNRSKKGVELTQVGNEVFRHCEQLFQTVHKIDEICRGISEVCEGPLNIATPDHVINYLLVHPLQQFRREYPLVIPRIFLGSPEAIIDDVVSGESEIALLFAKVARPQIVLEPLREEPMALVVQSDLWRAHKGANAAATVQSILKEVGYITSIGSNKNSRHVVLMKEVFGKVPRIGFEINGQEAQKRICLLGGGIAYLSRFMVEEEIRNGQLHEIQVEEPHSFNLWLATRKGEPLSAPARVFTDRLRTGWV